MRTCTYACLCACCERKTAKQPTNQPTNQPNREQTVTPPHSLAWSFSRNAQDERGARKRTHTVDAIFVTRAVVSDGVHAELKAVGIQVRLDWDRFRRQEEVDGGGGWVGGWVGKDKRKGRADDLARVRVVFVIPAAACDPKICTHILGKNTQARENEDRDCEIILAGRIIMLSPESAVPLRLSVGLSAGLGLWRVRKVERSLWAGKRGSEWER
jgi:hypothetical protein